MKDQLTYVPRRNQIPHVCQSFVLLDFYPPSEHFSNVAKLVGALAANDMKIGFIIALADSGLATALIQTWFLVTSITDV
jgi:hypothetical protein